MLLILSVVIQDVQAQLEEPGKWYFKTGVGSYHISSLPEFNQAMDFATEIGYRMDTGFYVGIGYSMAWVKTIYESSDGLDENVQIAGNFDGLDGQEIHHALRLMLSRHFVLGEAKRNMFSLGTGAFILGEQRLVYDAFPTAILELPDGEQFYQYEISQYKEEKLFHIPGFLFNVDYLFRLNKKIGAGIRLESLFLFDYGFDRYSLGPKISAFF